MPFRNRPASTDVADITVLTYHSSVSAADGPFSHPQRSLQLRTFSDEYRQQSSDSHEHYHALHFETLERTRKAEEEAEEEYDDEPASSGTRGRRSHPSVLNAHLEQTIAEMKEKILRLETHLGSASSHDDQPRLSGNIPESTLGPDIRIFGTNDKNGSNPLDIIPQLCERSWSDFMNKHIVDQHEYAIEVLNEEPDYRRPTVDTERISTRRGNYPALGLQSQKPANLTSPVPDANIVSLDRIRINSPWILDFLAGIDRHIDTTVPLVMLRPFKLLVQFEDKIMEAVGLLETQSSESGRTISSGESLQSSRDIAETRYEVSTLSRETDNQRLKSQHMRCLSEFIQRYLKPTLLRLQESSNRMVRFRDLWYIFRPGVNVHMPLRLPQGRMPTDTKSATRPPFEALQGRYHMNWRVTGTGGGRPNASKAPNRHTGFKSNPFRVNCYYIDFDGKYFCPTIHTFNILPFEGERDITTLDFFPLRYLKNSQEILKDNLDIDKMIYGHMASLYSHYYYVGPTLTTQPCSCPLQKEHIYQEHVESEVIIDFKLTLTEKPEWRPKPTVWKDPPIERREVQERYPVRYWKDVERVKLENSQHDQIYNDHYVDRESALLFRSNEQIYKPLPSPTISNASMVAEKDLALLAGRVFAFVLRTRTFGKPFS